MIDGDNSNVLVEYESVRHAGDRMTKDERRKKRLQKKLMEEDDEGNKQRVTSQSIGTELSDGRFADLLTKNEDELLRFVAQVNNVYQDKLGKDAPFMTFVILGMQSAGKSTLMERFLNAVLNIVQEGTGTRCPLDITCIHDDSCIEPSCELSGKELEEGSAGRGWNVSQVFESITKHNKHLAEEDRFSTESVRLVFHSKNVQNMRFVDTPGIISNKSTGKDNREDIRTILQSEMRKPNTKLCVLLEPKEYATNPIIEFCDDSFGSRDQWVNDATFLMTKFDKQLEDSRTGSKANNFFKEFHRNQCFPHLIITPTLPKEDLPPDELFEARRNLLDTADKKERERFAAWQEGHNLFRQNAGGDDEILNEVIQNRIGFSSAKKVMREIMLEDTARRLPEVLASLRMELFRCQKEEKTLQDKEKFNNPSELKIVVTQLLWHVEQRIISYLDGDLEASMKFPEMLQTLEDEIDEEEESEWSSRELNHYTDAEDHWRDRIANLETYSNAVQADKRFLGGKQVQRAIQFFRDVMIEALPDPFQLRDKVANVTGYLGGGLNRENWERAMVQITRVCVKDVSHPGINYLIKHVGNIFRRLFSLALDDVKKGEEFSATFKLLPTPVEKHLVCEFDDMLWDLLKSVADKTHCSLEPMYSTVDPDLPTFHPSRLDGNEQDRYVWNDETKEYDRLPNHKEKDEESWAQAVKRRMSLYLGTASGDEAKEFLRNESLSRAKTKTCFLPDERTNMVTDEETEKILRRSFEYIVALMEFNLHNLKFQLNHYLYEGFKVELSKSFKSKLINEADWDKLVEPDTSVAQRLAELKDQIEGLTDSLKEVQKMQRRI